MSILDEFRLDVRSRRGRIGEVARGSGVKLKTLQNILYMPARDPRGSTLEKLRAFYERERAA